MKIGIIYFSSTDITEKLVHAAVTAMEATSVDVYQHRIRGEEIVNGRFTRRDVLRQLSLCQAIILASPTYMGNVAAQFKAFIDATSEIWCEQAWSGKLAAGITCGSAPNGDQSSTLQYMITFANQHGMLWVGLDSAYGQKDHDVNRFGCQLGVVSQAAGEDAHPDDLATARFLGRRMAQLVKTIHHEPT